MTRTLVRQSSQIRQSDSFDDSLTPGVALESGSTSIEADLNGLRTQVKNLQGGANWYDALVGRSVETLGTDLLGIEQKPLLYRTQVLADIAVGNGNDFVILSVAGSEAPSEVAAVGAATTEGAVVALSTGFGASSLDLVAGYNAISPKNLVVIRDANTSDPITSGGKAVYGLLQSESGTNGAAFDDTANRVQISFVRENATGDGLELVPAADIENQTINYSYVQRVFFDNLVEDSFLGGAFVDYAGGGGGGSDLQSVIDAQGGTPVSSNNDTTIGFGASTYGWTFNHPNGGFTEFGYDEGFKHRVGSFPESFAVELGSLNTELRVGDSNFLNTFFRINSGLGSGGVAEFTVSDWSVTHNTAATFSGELRAGNANNYVSLGRFGDARVESEGGQDLIVKGSVALLLDDSYKDSSAWGGSANGIPLAEGASEWSAYADSVGNVSILAGITAAASGVNRQKGVAVVTTSTIAANTDLQSGVNTDEALPAYTGATFVDNVDVFLNGMLMRGGADAAANNDVYPGTDPSVGEIKFEFDLKLGDVVTLIRYGVVA